jgi:predicted nuclease of restriction endonuclease-like (RecB) superfamily
MTTRSMSYPEYPAFLAEVKSRIQQARLTAGRAVNRELILLYWDIGQEIVARQQRLGWGESVIDRLASDLRAEFPAATGFSPRNLRDMKRLYLTYSDAEIWRQPVAKLPPELLRDISRDPIAAGRQHIGSNVQSSGRATDEGGAAPFLRQLVAEIPWGQNLLILNKISDPAARLYYLRATAQFGWSRNVLLNQIKAGAYERAVLEKKTHNFDLALPERLAEQADEMLKSRYNLEFLCIRREVSERELEDRLISHLQRFILELGYGFCFIGRQHRLALGTKEYFVDLLFYHRFLKALIAFDLKVGEFEPEHTGKMDFYLNLLNEKERGPDDQPSIGIILCAEKDDIEVEFALKTKNNPIGVAEYQLQAKLPAEYKGRLPTRRQLADAVRSALPKEK